MALAAPHTTIPLFQTATELHAFPTAIRRPEPIEEISVMERQSLAIMQVLDTKHSDFHTDKAIDTSAEGDLTQHLRSHRALWAGYHAGNPGQHMAQKTSEKRDFDRIEQMGGGFAEGNLGVGSNFQDGLAHFVMGGMKAKRSSGSTKPGIGAARTKVYFLIVGVFVLPALM